MRHQAVNLNFLERSPIDDKEFSSRQNALCFCPLLSAEKFVMEGLSWIMQVSDDTVHCSSCTCGTYWPGGLYCDEYLEDFKNFLRRGAINEIPSW